MIVFVTGGSRGIGEAIVLEAVRQGHEVAFTYHQNERKAEEVVRRAREIAPSVRCRAYALDVRDSAAVEEVGDRVLDDFGDMGAVICNAGANLNGLAATMSDDDWKLVIDTNLTGTFYVCRQFLPTLVSNRFGRIVMISSVVHAGGTGQANYAASKAGMHGLSSTLSKEYGKKGITSNVVVLGVFETDMTREGLSDSNRDFWLRNCPLGRMGDPLEAAKTVLFLLSDGASYINGETISLTGGLGWTP